MFQYKEKKYFVGSLWGWQCDSSLKLICSKMALQSCWCIKRTIARAGCKGGGGALIILMFGGDNEIGFCE
jgi:hypothetical protein